MKKQKMPCLLYPNVSFVFDSLTPTASESAGPGEPESVQVFKVFFSVLEYDPRAHTPRWHCVSVTMRKSIEFERVRNNKVRRDAPEKPVKI